MVINEKNLKEIINTLSKQYEKLENCQIDNEELLTVFENESIIEALGCIEQAEAFLKSLFPRI